MGCASFERRQIFMPWARNSATTLSTPLFSRVRMPLVVSRSDTQRFSVSSQKRCVCRFGRKRRRFLLLAWETRLPTAGFLPVTSQTRDIETTLSKSEAWERGTGPESTPGPGFIPAPRGDLKAQRSRSGIADRTSDPEGSPVAWGGLEIDARGHDGAEPLHDGKPDAFPGWQGARARA